MTAKEENRLFELIRDNHRETMTNHKEMLDRHMEVIERVSKLEEAPPYVEVEGVAADSGSRGESRIFTGTIPDYTTEIEGLRLSGVVAGGPAAEAGLREGDVIVEFGGQSVANVYDYMYALDGAEIGVPVKVVFLRDGERLEASVTPRSRE